MHWGHVAWQWSHCSHVVMVDVLWSCGDSRHIVVVWCGSGYIIVIWCDGGHIVWRDSGHIVVMWCDSRHVAVVWQLCCMAVYQGYSGPSVRCGVRLAD